MEVKQLTRIQDKISTNRQRRRRTLRKLRNSNSASSVRSEASSNSGQNRLVVSKTRRVFQQTKSPEQILKRIFADSGWKVRRHFNDPEFRIPDLENRIVAFTLRGDNNELQKYSGVLKQASSAGTALFRLVGEEKVFNSNLVGFMAAQPS